LAGISRSAGLASALHYVLNGDDKAVFGDPQYVPNMHVRKTVLMEYFARKAHRSKNGK